MSVTIYYNPKCSKCRQTLALLEENGISPDIVNYLENPPSVQELKEILNKLGKSASDIMRSKEAKEAGLSGDMDEDSLIEGLIANPRAIERPIVVKGTDAVLGRPPENILKLI